MTSNRVTQEMTVKLAAVREARAKLQDKHFVWIIEAALEYFASAAKKGEAQILQYKLIPELPIFTRYGKDRGPDLRGATRESVLPKLRASVDEYYDILEFLQTLKDAEIVRGAEAFAAELRDLGGPRRRGRPRGGA